MLTINVAPDGSGQFTTISEAVLAVPYDCPAVIRIAPGIYREKLVCEKKDITLAGAGMDATRLVWNDGGKLPHPDGRPTHTFRSYTAFFSGEKLRVEDMTIENDAGPGAKAGQAVAAYVDSARAVFRRRADLQCFGRRLPTETLRSAAAVLMMYLGLFLLGGMAICCVEDISLEAALFETASALGTVGLTLGVTPGLGGVSRLILIFLMYFGRVGGLTLIYAVLPDSGAAPAQLPQERVTVG